MSKKTPAPSRSVYEFVTNKPENILEIETTPEGEVHTRMARGNFSAQRKACLVRELANEGFIPDHFLFLSDNELLGVKWSVSTDHVKLQPSVSRLANQRTRVLILSCLMLWSALMVALMLGAFSQ